MVNFFGIELGRKKPGSDFVAPRTGADEVPVENPGMRKTFDTSGPDERHGFNKPMHEKQALPPKEHEEILKSLEPLPEGERVKVDGENPYTQIEILNQAVDETLAALRGGELTDADRRAAKASWTDAEVMRYPKMNPAEARAFAETIAERMGWVSELGDAAIEAIDENDGAQERAA